MLAAIMTPEAPAAAGVTLEQIVAAVLTLNHGFPAEDLARGVHRCERGRRASSASPFTKEMDQAGHDCRGTLIFPGEQPAGAPREPVFDGLHGAWSSKAPS